MDECLHIVRNCEVASKVWSHLISPHFANRFFSRPLHEWIEENLKVPSGRRIMTNGQRNE